MATCTGVGSRAKYWATERTMEFSGLPAVFCPNWQAVKRKMCPEMEMPDISLSQPPRQVSASVRAAADDVPVDPRDRAVSSDDGSFAEAQGTAAAGKDGEVVCILKVATRSR